MPVIKETESVSNFVLSLIEKHLGSFSIANDFDREYSSERAILYLAYGESTREMIDGKIVPNRAIHQFGSRDVGGIIWNDEFIIVRYLPSGYVGLTDEEIKIAKRTFGKWSISYAHKLGFQPSSQE